MLEIRNLRAGYANDRIIVDGLDLHVEAGEIVTVIGQNGAGKSTMLKGIANLVRVRSGDVRLGGESVFARSAQMLLAAGLAYVPQARSVFPRLSVAENLRMGGFLLRDRALLAERITRAQALFPALTEFAASPAGNLSGGQQRMLEIARALVMDPRVIMLDEPSIGLAPRITDQVFATLRRLAEQGRAVLMVEQNVRRALEVSDRGYVLELGRTRLEDRADALLRDDRVARLYMGGH